MLDENYAIVICGPTAVGKSAIALSIANSLGGEIISADSRQCYHELNIGVARPSAEELESITHHFIAQFSIAEPLTAGDFERFALQKSKELFKANKLPIICGGTGLYIKAFCEGLDEIPLVPEEMQNHINERYKEKGLAWLQSEVRNADPDFYSTGNKDNPHRLLRALGVHEATGKSILHFQKNIPKPREFKTIKIGLELPREQLYEKINRRVDEMIENGLVAEAEGLADFQHLPAMNTVGYAEIFDYLNGKCTLPQAIEKIKQHTRNYAKRQLTWFKKDTQITWFSAADVGAIQRFIQDAGIEK